MTLNRRPPFVLQIDICKEILLRLSFNLTETHTFLSCYFLVTKTKNYYKIRGTCFLIKNQPDYELWKQNFFSVTWNCQREARMKSLLRGLIIILNLLFFLHPVGTQTADTKVNERLAKFQNPLPFYLFVLNLR